MSGTGNVEAYFSGVAAGYQRASKGRLWGIIRHREAGALMGLLGDVAGRHVLELGCGAGFYTRLLLARGAAHVTAVDISDSMVAQLPADRVTGIVADAETFEAGQEFDCLLSAGMLEFVPSPAAVLANAARHAEPGACLGVLVPTATFLGRAYRRFHTRNGLEIALFDRARLAALAETNGWSLRAYVAGGPYSAAALLVREAR